MKKTILFIIIVLVCGILLTACSDTNNSYFGIVYDSCNLGQCVQVEKRWNSKFDFTITEGIEYCLVGQKNSATFFAPDGYYWEKAKSGNCYQIKND